MSHPELTNPADIDASVKRQFFSNLALSAISEMRIHRASRQIGVESHVGVQENGRPKRWGDPTQHCLVEAAAGVVLGDMIGLSPEDQAVLRTAALVHDATKRPEIEALQAARAAGKTNQEIDAANDAASAVSKRTLLDAGVDPRAVELTETVGHLSLPLIAHLNTDNTIQLNEDVDTLTLTMHYIDDITRGSEIVNFDERIDMLEAVAAERYLYNEAGRAIWGGRTYFEAQREVGHLVQAGLAAMAGIEDPVALPDAINRGLVELITAS